MIHPPIIRFSAGALVALTLTGCATFSGQAPSCDGASRRPLNRSLWDWERGPLAGGPALAAPSPPKPSPTPQAAATDGSGPAPVASVRPGVVPSPALPATSIAGSPAGATGPARIDVAASLRACGGSGDTRHG